MSGRLGLKSLNQLDVEQISALLVVISLAVKLSGIIRPTFTEHS